MKNIIKIVSSALVAILVLGTVAFAAPGSGNGTGSGSGVGSGAPSNGSGTGSGVGSGAPSSGSGTGSGVGSGAPSSGSGTGSGVGTNAPSHGSGTGSGVGSDSSSNGGDSSEDSSKPRRRSSGGGSYRQISLTNVQVSVAGNKATVTWDTTPAAQGMLVYGPLSLAIPTNATAFYGYAAGTTLTGAGMKHVHIFTMAPNVTYYVRPVAIVGSRVVYGSEIKVGKGTTVITKTAAPAVGTIFDAPTKVKIDSKIPADVQVSKATTTATTSNVANISAATPKAKGFFTRFWNSITAPFCN